MEELQVGEFIRTKSGELYKIDYVGESVVTAGEEVIIPLNYIENHSFEPIDLVKKSDYVNGKKVKSIQDYEEFKKVCFDEDFDDVAYSEDIKTIVTSEKFASVEFKVEE